MSDHPLITIGDADFKAWLQGYDMTMEPLAADIHWTDEIRRAKDSEILRRMYIRALFAFIEADTWQRKLLILMFHQHGAPLEPGELSMAREEQHVLNNRGILEIQPKFLPLPRNYRFTFLLAARVLDSTFRLDVSGQEWHAFTTIHEVRNRLTHPKSAADLQVSEGEMSLAINTFQWVGRNAVELVQGTRCSP